MIDVSIIIPTKNSGDTLEKCLASLVNSPFEGVSEVIIVDGHSTDDTIDIAKRYRCKVVYENVGNQAAAYNLGLRISKGRFIAFTDADCVVQKDWLKNLVKNFSGDVAAVGGPNLTPNDDTEFGKRVGIVISLLSKVGARYGLNAPKIMETFHNPTCNVAYRREVLEEVCGFNEKLVTCADEEIDYRIIERKYRILYTPEAKVLHYRRTSYRGFALQAYKYAVGRAQAIKLHPKMGKWFHFAPSLIMCMTGVSFAFSILNPIYLWVPLLIVAHGGFAIFFASLFLSLKTRMSNPFSFFALMATWFWGYGIGFLRGVLA